MILEIGGKFNVLTTILEIGGKFNSNGVNTKEWELSIIALAYCFVFQTPSFSQSSASDNFIYGATVSDTKRQLLTPPGKYLLIKNVNITK